MPEEMKKKPMRRKAKAAEPVATPSAPPAPSRVKLADMWSMRLAQQERRAALAELEAAKFKRLYALKVLDPKGTVLSIEKSMEEARKKAERAENQELVAKKRMEHDLGRSMANLAIDPDTGEVADFSKE
jgi:hypothetical protein